MPDVESDEGDKREDDEIEILSARPQELKTEHDLNRSQPQLLMSSNSGQTSCFFVTLSHLLEIAAHISCFRS